jgi:tetratricopeptide (TPR) repeat protein
MFNLNISSIATLLALLTFHRPALSQDVPGVIYIDQPKDIDSGLYLSAWPSLRECISKLQSRDTVAAQSCLENLAAQGRDKDGALNLLTQIERRQGNLDQAWETIDKAIELSPKQHLHYFQKALVAFKQRENTSFFLSQWKWHVRTKDAYEHAMALEPRMFPYRYYVFYSYINTPAIGGGDKGKALKIAQDGIDLGFRECYLMRADAYRVLDKFQDAFRDYDTSITLRIFKKNLESFRAAGYAAMDQKDRTHAKRYFDYLVECRADRPDSYDCLGDYYIAVGDTLNAIKAFGTALEKNPKFESSLDKVRRLRK